MFRAILLHGLWVGGCVPQLARRLIELAGEPFSDCGGQFDRSNYRRRGESGHPYPDIVS
jgi:hypothetical protein